MVALDSWREKCSGVGRVSLILHQVTPILLGEGPQGMKWARAARNRRAV